MNDFWKNIVRYPRFFISSLFGLILVILTPVRNLVKVPKLKIFIVSGLLIVTALLYITLTKMLGF